MFPLRIFISFVSNDSFPFKLYTLVVRVHDVVRHAYGFFGMYPSFNVENQLDRLLADESKENDLPSCYQ